MSETLFTIRDESGDTPLLLAAGHGKLGQYNSLSLLLYRRSSHSRHTQHFQLRQVTSSEHVKALVSI
jgi:ankyrin repeat protein